MVHIRVLIFLWEKLKQVKKSETKNEEDLAPNPIAIKSLMDYIKDAAVSENFDTSSQFTHYDTRDSCL